jgi:hypothetical protein
VLKCAKGGPARTSAEATADECPSICGIGALRLATSVYTGGVSSRTTPTMMWLPAPSLRLSAQYE